MLKEDEILKEGHKKVRIACPKCKKEKILQIPTEIKNVSEHLITISIPADFVCKHSFQAFIDKDFYVRAYQNADFEISKIEYYESKPKVVEELIDYSLSLLIKNIIIILREVSINKAVLGTAIFDMKGKVLYSSLPDIIFLKMVQELDTKKENKKVKLKRIIFVLDDEKKVFSEFIKIRDITLVIIITFTSEVNLNDGDQYIRKIEQKINELEKAKEKAIKREIKEGPSPYWIYSTISKKNLFKDSETIYLESLNLKVSRSVILNLTEILSSIKADRFEGKIYFAEKYVKLMEGLALTLKDAEIFIKSLNKMP